MIHIHNGDVVAVRARRTSIPGEHLSFRESLVTGPIVPGEQWLELRAKHHAAMSNEELLRVSNDLFEQEQALEAAAGQDEIVLWFEHDLFCLIHCVYLLQRFRTNNLSIVWSREPLSESSDEDLVQAFALRRPVTTAMLEAAIEVWGDYASSDPTSLNRWLDRDVHDFPFLRDGLLLHARRFPSARNGLGALEQRSLALIDAGVIDFGSLFPRLDSDPPRYGFGDTQVLAELRALAERNVPLITMTESPGDPSRVAFTITDAGRKVATGAADDGTLNERDLWLGGAHLTKETMWRFDDATQRIIASRPAGS